MRLEVVRWVTSLGCVLAVGCGGKAVTTSDGVATSSRDSGSGSTATGGSASVGSGSGVGGSRATTTGSSAMGGSTSPPSNPQPPDQPPPDQPPPDQPPPDQPPPDQPPPGVPPGEPQPPVPPPGQPRPPVVPIPGTCSSDYSTVEDGYCELDLQCGGRYAYAECEGDAGTANCYCEGDRYYGDFVVSGSDLGAACNLVAGYCVQGFSADFGAVMCGARQGQASNGYCTENAECTRVAALPDNVTLETHDWPNVYCEQNGATWSCECNSSLNSVSFEFAEATSEVCPDVFDACVNGSIEASGPRQCTQSSQSASQDTCNATLDCTQDGSIAGAPVRVHSSIWMSCQADGSDWRCSCDQGPDAQTFTASGDDAWSACQAASETCAELAAGG